MSLLIVISGCELLEGGVEDCEGGEGGDKCEGGEGTERRLRVLERVLKTLENVRFKIYILHEYFLKCHQASTDPKVPQNL